MRAGAEGPISISLAENQAMSAVELLDPVATAAPAADESGDGQAPRPRMTLEEFHALPDDDAIDRMLIRGELWEGPMTKRNKRHARIETRVAYLLEAWSESQPESPGEVFSGEAGIDFPELETGVGVDVAYFPNQSLAGQAEEARFLVGPPALAVEILSPSDRVGELWAKLDDYLAAGVNLVWIVDPHFAAVTVYRPDGPPVLVAGDEELSGEPHLPGFRVPAAKLFSR